MRKKIPERTRQKWRKAFFDVESSEAMLEDAHVLLRAYYWRVSPQRQKALYEFFERGYGDHPALIALLAWARRNCSAAR